MVHNDTGRPAAEPARRRASTPGGRTGIFNLSFPYVPAPRIEFSDPRPREIRFFMRHQGI
jgi:hypothetical protein